MTRTDSWRGGRPYRWLCDDASMPRRPVTILYTVNKCEDDEEERMLEGDEREEILQCS